MAIIGADPEQLAQLGRTLRQQITVIDGVTSAVSAGLAATTWTGPAREQFEREWNEVFRLTLSRLVYAFDVAGGDCVARSAELLRVMGR